MQQSPDKNYSITTGDSPVYPLTSHYHACFVLEDLEIKKWTHEYSDIMNDSSYVVSATG